MDEKLTDIGNDLRRITHTDKRDRKPIMSGKVVSVQESDMTATVQLTMDDEDTPTEGILLNVTEENESGMYLIPAADADCEVAELDGDGKLTMVRASSYTKVICKAGTLIQLNDGSEHGLMKVVQSVQAWNNLENDCNNLKGIMTGILAALSAAATGAPGAPVTNATLYSALSALNTYATAALTVTARINIENTKVTHG